MSRELLNTLFVQTPRSFLRLDGDTIKVEVGGEKRLQVPLLHITALILFGDVTVSSALMMRCAREDREITFLDFSGRFRCRVVGPASGNVLLRKAQFDAHACVDRTLAIARPIVAGMIKNTRQTLLRAGRETNDPMRAPILYAQAEQLAALLVSLPAAATIDAVRGLEGQAAACYFSVFGEMIVRRKVDFAFALRSRRPPRDRMNALLSFLYALLTTDCAAAVEGVGLDPQFGYLHTIRPGRPALALDLVEEFRSYLADRLALTLVNRKQIDPDHFDERPGGSVMLNEKGRKVVLAAYQERKKEEVAHPLLQSKSPLGLLPHLQARILARHLRGDLPCYLPFISR